MSVLRPTGPEPASVYWRRRLVVLLALVVVIVLLVSIMKALFGGGSAESAAESTPTPTTQTQAQTGTAACDPASISVQLTADATDYPAGAQPLFTITMTNSGATSCLLDAGDAQRQIVITSGSDRIWASTDCATGEVLQLLLAPQQSDQRQTQWDRTRSDEACSTGLPVPQSGTYQALLTLNGVSSAPVVFTLS